MKLFRKSRIELGEGHVTQYIVFEFKHLASLIFYRWETVDQVRLHSHAFASVAVLLRGWYNEQVMHRGGHVANNTVDQRFKLRWIPHHYTPRILDSAPGTLTMVMTGPWSRFWYEYFDDTATWVEYTWGRKVTDKGKRRPDFLR